ncbi:hypothetical protein PR202_ga00487 [Eleusine coracana subsp. coracana]|uniref:Uncharacterized protein n=1 Tax=Eleusine coracana subsp. coracana TaxID=191504 RepID=A0AAV5BFN8_ELECO|nr:hypothetical protein PR202_ga00487 [Eleusine coracana subsp. coracana]
MIARGEENEGVRWIHGRRARIYRRRSAQRGGEKEPPASARVEEEGGTCWGGGGGSAPTLGEEEGRAAQHMRSGRTRAGWCGTRALGKRPAWCPHG